MIDRNVWSAVVRSESRSVHEATICSEKCGSYSAHPISRTQVDGCVFSTCKEVGEREHVWIRNPASCYERVEGVLVANDLYHRHHGAPQSGKFEARKETKP